MIMPLLFASALGFYEIMEFQHDWNTEVVAQFYATLFVEEDDRRMH